MAHLSYRVGLLAAATALLFSCEQREDLAFTRPDWREAVNRDVSFPLEEPLTLSVGMAQGMSAPAADNASLEWLRERTGITLEFVAIPQSPGDIEFGQMIRGGRLPDIVAEARVDLDESTMHRLFVDFLEFGDLVPTYSHLLRESPAARAGALSRLTANGELLSMGTYDAGARPFAGVLAHRQDLFEEHGLSAGTWQELRESMERLKELRPDSFPLGGEFATMLRFMPSWFGSGFDPRHIVYFDVDEGEWRFGPFEEGFKDFVTFLADAFSAGLVDPDFIVADSTQVARNFAGDYVFLAPYTRPTGPNFATTAEGYGGVTDDGLWDGTGWWIAPLELPAAPAGRQRWTAPGRFSPVGPGWLVHNQGDHVGEAIALLDFLFTDEAAAVLALGPPETHWAYEGERVVLSEATRAAYDREGVTGLARYIAESGLAVGLPVRGRELDYYEAFGYPASPRIRYHLDHDIALNEACTFVMEEPGVRIPTDDQDFSSARIDVVVTLRSHIESQVANFVFGRRDLAEWDDFVEEARRMGADRLLGLYNERAVVPPRDTLAPLLGE